MKTITKKISIYLIPLLFVILSFHFFNTPANAEEFRIERVCSNGICIVTVYNTEGAIVNVYEELDSNP